MADLREFAKIDRFWDNLTRMFYIFLKEIIICSLNNYDIEKWADGKAFYIMASAQFFAT